MHSFEFMYYIFYLICSTSSCRGSKIFPTFIGFLKSKDPSDGTEQALLNELASFNDYLKENVSLLSPFVFPLINISVSIVR